MCYVSCAFGLFARLFAIVIVYFGGLLFAFCALDCAMFVVFVFLYSLPAFPSSSHSLSPLSSAWWSTPPEKHATYRFYFFLPTSPRANAPQLVHLFGRVFARGVVSGATAIMYNCKAIYSISQVKLPAGKPPSELPHTFFTVRGTRGFY